MKGTWLKKTLAISMAAALLVGTAACAKPPKGEAEAPAVTASMLSESPFNVEEAKQNYVNPAAGLKNPYNVGIHKDDFENQVLYPAPADQDSIVIDASATKYGMTGNDIEDDTRAMQLALGDAKAEKKKAGNEDKPVKIKLPAGKVYFYEGFYDPALDIAEDPSMADTDIIGKKYGIAVFNIDDLTIEGATENGELKTEIVFVGELGFRGMKVFNCDNFRLYNLQVDWGNLPFYSGEVKSVSADKMSVVVETYEDYPLEAGTEIIEYQEFDPTTLVPRTNGNFLHNHNEVEQIPVTEVLSSHEVRLTFSAPINEPPVGTKVSISKQMHFSETFMIEKCTDVYLETVYVYCAPGMALRSYSNENLYINRYMAVLKPGTDRLQVGTSDLLHIKNTKGEVVITNSQLENAYDDAVNVGGHFTRPYSKNAADNSAVLRWPGGMTGTFMPEQGDILMLTDINSMEAVGYYKVESVQPEPANGDGYKVVFDTQGGTAVAAGEEVTLETDISKIADANTQAFANLTRTPQLTIRNCLIRNKRNRGLLIQTRNVLIENCAFSNILHGALSLLSEVSTFNESTPPKNVIIRNNKFLNNDTNDISVTAYGNQLSMGSPEAIQGITIENNFFAYTRSTPAVYLQGCSGITMNANWIYKNCTDASAPDANKVAIKLANVAEMTISKNKVEKFRPSYLSITAIGSCDLETVTLTEDNEGIERTELFGEAKDITVKKSTAAITIDGDLSDWEGVEASSVEMEACTDIHVSPVALSTIDANDFSQTTKITWTDEGIYIMFDVVDETVQFIQNSWWLGDGMELFLSTSDSYSVTDSIKGDDSEDCLQMFVKLNSDLTGMSTVIAPERTTDRIVEKSGEILSAMKLKADKKGYTGEVFLPFSVLTRTKESIDAGGKIAISINFGDSDNDTGGLYNDLFMTFSNTPHPTTTNKMVPGAMTKFIFE